ncbi:hypothetical protein QR680_013253 [Steinernema hermaphroditum]|uniref:VWFA domain-containing protein n=1 Tax=Steinernema hermaphroditum TaxID=289476 RepID=A0AA39M279_9BILA|nr:hypothetical protein QR680_013253 [Steinernema hermaphroditum]
MRALLLLSCLLLSTVDAVFTPSASTRSTTTEAVYISSTSSATQRAPTSPAPTMAQTTSGGCVMAVDLVFVQDQSGSIGQSNYETAKNDIIRFVQTLSIGNLSTDSRVGLVLFDNSPSVQFYLNTFTDEAELVDAIENLPYSAGGTNIAAGLQTAINQVFGGPGNRPGIPDVMILITDGNDGDINGVRNAHQLAVRKGITTYALGVGDGFDSQELAAATGSSSSVFSAANWADMEKALQSMYSSICESVGPATSTPIPTAPAPIVETARGCSQNFENLWLDIVFLLDSSMGVDSEGFNFEVAMLYGLIHEMKVSQELGQYTRVAFVNVGSAAHRVSNLTSYENAQEAAEDLMRLKYLGDADLNVGAGLEEVQRILDDSDQRENVKNLVVLFSSNEVDCKRAMPGSADEYPCRIAATIKERGALLLTVAMTFHETEETPLLSLATPCFATRNDVHFRKEFQRLALLANCFCLAPYAQFAAEDTCQRFGECLYLAESPSDFQSARFGCQREQATLPDVFSAAKEKFLEDIARKEGHFPFWIGLSNLANHSFFHWDTDFVFSPRIYQKFEHNIPLNGVDIFCVGVRWINNALGFKKLQWIPMGCDFSGPSNYYFCQKDACDADHYCA